MKKLIACLLIVMLLGSGLAACSDKSGFKADKETTPTKPTASEPKNTLDFTVTDTQGNSVKLSDFAGKPVVVNFWATWCNPCTSELPEFEAAAKANPNIQFMMVNATDGRDETPEMVTEFIAENGYTFPVFYDHKMAVIQDLQIQAFPTTLFIDAEGNVVNSYVGMMDAATLEEGLDMIR